MNIRPFGMNVVTGQDACTIYLSGEIDYAASLKLTPALENITRECMDALQFDLDEVTLIDSEGIKMLAAAFEQMYQKHKRARIIRCSEQVVRVIKFAGMYELLTMNHAWFTSHKEIPSEQPQGSNIP